MLYLSFSLKFVPVYIAGSVNSIEITDNLYKDLRRLWSVAVVGLITDTVCAVCEARAVIEETAECGASSVNGY